LVTHPPNMAASSPIPQYNYQIQQPAHYGQQQASYTSQQSTDPGQQQQHYSPQQHVSYPAHDYHAQPAMPSQPASSFSYVL
jgi:hypothetical protein